MFADHSFWYNENAGSDYSDLWTIEELHPAGYTRSLWKGFFILHSNKFYSKMGAGKTS